MHHIKKAQRSVLIGEYIGLPANCHTTAAIVMKQNHAARG
jgi:hypothetical protein